MSKKARNYVGNNVLLVKGKLTMEKAREKQKFKKYIKE